MKMMTNVKQLLFCGLLLWAAAAAAVDLIPGFEPGTVRAKYVDRQNKLYLRVGGDPSDRHNPFRFAYYRFPKINGGEVIRYTAECKVDSVTSGRFEIGVYEFADAKAVKTIRLQSVKVDAAPGWQTITRTIKLRPDAKAARFYLISRGTGEGDVMTVRKLDAEVAEPTPEDNVLSFESGSAPLRFEDCDGGKFLKLAGDPSHKHNKFFFNYIRVPDVKGGDLVTYKITCKMESLSAGKARVGIYEFADPDSRTSIRFQQQALEAAPGWQTITGTVRLKPEARSARLYLLAMGLNKNDVILVRSVEIKTSNPASGGLIGNFEWSGAVKAQFVDSDGGIALKITGDPKNKTNAFRYAYCPLPELRGGDELTFTAECKVPSLTLPGVVHVGIYEFADPKAHKVVRFQLVRVEPGDDWQTVSKRVKLAPETQCARFYLIGRNLAQGETLLVRKATVEKH